MSFIYNLLELKQNKIIPFYRKFDNAIAMSYQRDGATITRLYHEDGNLYKYKITQNYKLNDSFERVIEKGNLNPDGTVNKSFKIINPKYKNLNPIEYISKLSLDSKDYFLEKIFSKLTSK